MSIQQCAKTYLVLDNAVVLCINNVSWYLGMSVALLHHIRLHINANQDIAKNYFWLWPNKKNCLAMVVIEHINTLCM